MEIVQSQLSDARLYQMIEEVKNTEEQERPNIIGAVMRVQDTKSSTLEIVNQTNKDITEARKRIFTKLFPVNKRIEVLLSGEPSN